ncbi:electron transport complex subunit RsxA [bacterium]|nr:electron transport complex subunit RsxA [bacterium]
MDFERLFTIVLANILVSNFILARFLGLCPFIGVSKRTQSAIGMGMAVTFVMTLASFISYVLYTHVLKANATLLVALLGADSLLAQHGLEAALRTVSYILIIASLVQLVEMFLRKAMPALYRALGIYLPLITTNCAVMGVALLNTTDAPEALTLVEAVLQGFCAGVGFTLAMLLMSGIRERLELIDVPRPLRGVPIAFVCTGLMALAFLGFAGMA